MAPGSRRRARARTGEVAAVMALALALRLAWLGSVPPGIIPDEHSIGYDAYSLLLTGRDMHGTPWPLLFRSLGEYKNPLCIYAAIPSVMLLGLNATAVRLPSVAFGTLAVGATFLLGRALGGRRAGLVAALLLAVSPWHQHLTRLALDPVPVPFLVAAGWWLLEAGLRGSRRAMPLAALSFALALYAYAVPRLFVPLFLAGVLAARRDLVRARPREVALFVIMLAALLLPLARAYVATPDAANARFTMVSIFTDDSLMWARHRWGAQSGPVLYGLQFAENYLAHLSPDFLFLHGDASLRFSSRDTGKLYLFESALLAAGLWSLARRRRPSDLVLLGALALSPVAASLTNDAIPHSLRTVVALPFLQLACALGWLGLSPVLRRWGVRPLVVAGAALIVAAHLWHYFVAYPADPGVSYYWYAGWEEAGSFLREHAGEYDEVRVPLDLRQAQRFIQFHTARDPALVQRGDWGPYNFTSPCSYREDGGVAGVLYVVALEGWPLPERCRYDDLGLEVVRDVAVSDGRTALRFLARPRAR